MIGRSDKNGPQGNGINIDKSFTLNTTDRHAIAVRTAQTGANGIGVADERAHTLDGANGQAVAYKNFTPSSFGGYQEGVGTLRANGDTPLVLMDQGGGVMNVEYNKTGTLRRETHGHEPIIMEEKAMAFAQNTRDEVRYQNGDGQIVGALAAQPGMKQTTYIKTNTVVRRLTPVECERLQGFPDGYTNIPWKGKPSSPDGRRYKALGNSMAVPVMQWIGRRIEGAREVVYDEEAIRNVMLPPLSDDEIKHGQQMLF